MNVSVFHIQTWSNTSNKQCTDRVLNQLVVLDFTCFPTWYIMVLWDADQLSYHNFEEIVWVVCLHIHEVMVSRQLQERESADVTKAVWGSGAIFMLVSHRWCVEFSPDMSGLRSFFSPFALTFNLDHEFETNASLGACAQFLECVDFRVSWVRSWPSWLEQLSLRTCPRKSLHTSISNNSLLWQGLPDGVGVGCCLPQLGPQSTCICHRPQRWGSPKWGRRSLKRREKCGWELLDDLEFGLYRC